MMQVCPVCNGRQTVPAGFYSHGVLGRIGTNAAPQECRTCNGSGMVAMGAVTRTTPTTQIYRYNGPIQTQWGPCEWVYVGKSRARHQ